MTDGVTLLDLSAIRPPDAVRALDYEALFATFRTRFLELWEDAQAGNPALSAYTVGVLETDPAMIIGQAWSYERLLDWARINDAVRAVLLASATGADLDQVAADLGVLRRDGESDAALRARRLLATSQHAVAGPKEAYEYHALATAPSCSHASARVDASGAVRLSLLSATGDGSVGAETIAAVATALGPKALRPMTDHLYVQSAVIVPVAVSLRLLIGSGPAEATIQSEALTGLHDYVARRRLIGAPLYLDGLIGAARSAKPVERAIVLSPASDVDPGPDGAVHVTGVSVEVQRVS